MELLNLYLISFLFLQIILKVLAIKDFQPLCKCYGQQLFSNVFIKEKDKKMLPITDERMTRFNITLEQGVDMVLFALNNSMEVKY